ncbi:MAG: hypothetical protein AABX73_02785 [Nanoarchaeota archaeon]
MIKTITNSEFDNEKIAKILTPIDEQLQNYDFSKVVVKKPWGYEYLMYQNNNLSIWILHIKKEFSTSMHCHLKKKTALFVLYGEVVCTTLQDGLKLNEGDGLILSRKVFHSTQALSENGAIIMEVEVPSRKTDLLRLSDSYGREAKGYESEDYISSDLSEFSYVSFSEREFDMIKKIRNAEICLKNFNEDASMRDYFSKEKNGIGVVLEGKLVNDSDGKYFEIGDIFQLNALKEIENMIVIGATTILKINKPSNESYSI